jgi:hypothetical protein
VHLGPELLLITLRTPSIKMHILYTLNMAGSHQSPRSFFLALLLPLLVVLSAAAAAASYETKPLDPGLAMMTLPQPVSGPESLAFDGRGQGPYSGVSDGRILRWHGRRQGWI